MLTGPELAFSSFSILIYDSNAFSVSGQTMHMKHKQILSQSPDHYYPIAEATLKLRLKENKPHLLTLKSTNFNRNASAQGIW